MDCKWGDWEFGKCSKSCGGGITNRTRIEKIRAKHGGKECSGFDTEEQSCNTQACSGMINLFMFDKEKNITNIDYFRAI